MTREQLEHVIRAAASITGEDRIVILGSQAILASIAAPPDSLTYSMEADAFPEGAPEKCDIIDGCIGELSPFHETFGYYVHGIRPESAHLPRGWRTRLVTLESPATYGSQGLCLSVPDLAVSKLLAGREKDFAFVNSLLAADLVAPDQIESLAAELDEPLRARLSAALESLKPSNGYSA